MNNNLRMILLIINRIWVRKSDVIIAICGKVQLIDYYCVTLFFFIEFQNFDASSAAFSPNTFAYSPSNTYSPNPTQYQPNIFTPTFEPDQYKDHPVNSFDDEPPLLEELEIYPTRIIEKSLAVLNPFHSRGLSNDAEFLFKVSISKIITRVIFVSSLFYFLGK